MCKFKAERLIKELLKKYHCRFLTSSLEDGILIVRYINTCGHYTKDTFAYRYLTEQDVENKITKVVE